MPDGYIAFVLHAHLPYVRHPEHETFLEEQWLFEAITETYIPLLRMIERLEDDGVDYALLLSLSPPLVAMLEDELLQDRYVRHLHKTIALADREVVRTASDPVFHRLAEWYADFFRDALYWFEEKCQRRLTQAFRKISELGHLDLMTCAATHGFLPFLRINPAAVRAQVHTAVEYHTEIFGQKPTGMWLPECAYYVGLETILEEAGIRYFFLDSVGLEHAAEKPRYGIHAPIYTSNGIAAFARDRETSYQVWAAEIGYPGHPDYREFYRDIGFDLPEEQIRDFLIDGHIRQNTGIKYYRITSRHGPKEPYNPERARERAAEHAGNFLFNRQRQVEYLRSKMDRPPIIVSPYDAELFGHWWFEGPKFLDYVFRKMCYDQAMVKAITPARYLELFPENQVTLPAGSSWGQGSTYEYWMNEQNDHIYRDLHRAADRLTELVDSLPSPPPDAYRLLQQMMRELMLAQASDWPFIMKTGTSPSYAMKRVEMHLSRFWALEEMLTRGPMDICRLEAVEYMDAIFPHVRPEWYASRGRKETP